MSMFLLFPFGAFFKKKFLNAQNKHSHITFLPLLSHEANGSPFPYFCSAGELMHSPRLPYI